MLHKSSKDETMATSPVSYRASAWHFARDVDQHRELETEAAMTGFCRAGTYRTSVLVCILAWFHGIPDFQEALRCVHHVEWAMGTGLPRCPRQKSYCVTYPASNFFQIQHERGNSNNDHVSLKQK